jgi:hypothetical protein
MEALRHASEGELCRYGTRIPSPLLRSRKHATVFKARLRGETGVVYTETKSFRTDALMEALSKSQPQTDGDDTADGNETVDQVRHDARLELITLPRIGDRRDRIGLDQASLLEIYKYLNLDPWLLGQLCRRSSGWTCCTFAEGITNFQLMTSMYYIAWSVNTTLAATSTKAILLAQELISHSRSFSAEPMLDTLLRTSVVSLRDPFGLANLVLLDIISYMEGELDHQRGIEIQSENLSGHGVFGYRHQEKTSDLETKHLASAVKEIGVSIGMVSYCNHLAEIAEQMVLDLQDEVAKLMAPRGDPESSVRANKGWTGHTSMMQSLHLNMKRVWNLKVAAKDLDNRVKAQSNTVSVCLVIFSALLG